MSNISQRKKDHVDLTITNQTQYQMTSGFERFYFQHNALPEINFDEISTEASLLNNSFSFPLFISSMTGGYTEAGPVNEILSIFCEANNIPFGVGSQRAMLVDENQINSFSIARKKAPNAFIAGNIGGVQLIKDWTIQHTRKLIDSIEANALIVHLNPLQELMQPEGDRSFLGVLQGIETLVKHAGIPIIVKETGAGISRYSAERLLNIGVQVIDVSGSGGTSWSKVENQRATNKTPQHLFDEWGIPTVECLRQISSIEWKEDFELIASGGIRSALDIGKALCLGANFTATAQPVIKAVIENGYDGLESYYKSLVKDFKTLLLLLGCSSPHELNRSHLLEK
jgi:isopentenyl-diphosphate delta-isomerase